MADLSREDYEFARNALRRYYPDNPDVDDAVQQAAIRYCALPVAPRCKPSTWLVGRAKLRVIDAWRRARHRDRLHRPADPRKTCRVASPATSPLEQLEALEEWARRG